MITKKENLHANELYQLPDQLLEQVTGLAEQFQPNRSKSITHQFWQDGLSFTTT